MKKILIIEDDTVISQQLRTLLRNNHYEVDEVTDFEDVVSQVKVFEPHLILLDVNLPVQNGFELCTEIRSFSQVPIIFVTSRNTDMDELNSIILGGDAFITKPYHTAILLAKITSLLNKAGVREEKNVLEHQQVQLFIENSRIRYADLEVGLTYTEFQIMLYLFRHKQKICSRSDMIEFLWNEKIYIDDNALSVNITRIREKLKSIGIVNFIQTKHRQGYMI